MNTFTPAPALSFPEITAAYKEPRLHKHRDEPAWRAERRVVAHRKAHGLDRRLAPSIA